MSTWGQAPLGAGLPHKKLQIIPTGQLGTIAISKLSLHTMQKKRPYLLNYYIMLSQMIGLPVKTTITRDC